MKIIALDVSTRSTGWFIDEGTFGKIEIDAKLDFPSKLVLFRKELFSIIKQYRPKKVIIEDVHYRRGFSNIHTVKALSKFGGVATELCAQKKIEVVLMTSTAARKHLELEKKVTKEDVFNYFNSKYNKGWNFKEYNDVTDAWMLHYAWNIENELQKTKKKSAKKKSNTS